MDRPASRRLSKELYKREIDAGEELTVDYMFSGKIGRVRCRCGASACRGTINLQ